MTNKIKSLIVLGMAGLPAISLAQQEYVCSTEFTTIGHVLNWATCVISNAVVPLLFSIALVIFVYGVVKFIRESDSKQKEEGKNFMIWGIIGLFVMLSVWGLVNVLNVTFGVRNVIPQLPSTQ